MPFPFRHRPSSSAELRSEVEQLLHQKLQPYVADVAGIHYLVDDRAQKLETLISLAQECLGKPKNSPFDPRTFL
jgi:hypothetical protein